MCTMAVRAHPAMVHMLQQDMYSPAHLDDSVGQLHHIVQA